MRHPILRATSIFVLISALSACGDCGPSPGDETDLGMSDGGADLGSPDAADLRIDMTVDARYGLDARPANPDCTAPARPAARRATVELTRVFEQISMRAPIAMLRAPGDDDHWYLVEQPGVIRRFEDRDDVATSSEFLDIESRVRDGGERGLIGAAFHPDYAQNGRVYVHYTYDHPDDGLTSRVARFEKIDGEERLDPQSEKVIFEVGQPYGNHNGGHLEFGPDGSLYIAYGDGGSAGDPENNGQDTSTTLGAILRLDVDGGDPYAIPADNPFADGGGAPEIYAWGLRNPWKFSFDPVTGRLWAGDVGQGSREEVDLIERGGNYGWKIREGSICYRNHPECDRGDLIDPVVDYPHSEGRSITGGHVYHGEAIEALRGKYLNGDFATGKLWALGEDPQTGEWTPEVLSESTGLMISAFARDGSSGELYVLDYAARQPREPGVYRIDPSDDDGGGAGDGPARMLSQTGCVDPQDPTRPAAGLVPYEPRVPFWSDGAGKERWIALPDAASITLDEEGGWIFPNGTVFVKLFRLDGRPVETRLFVRHDDGVWAGYSYRWDEAGEDAELLETAETRTFGGQRWQYPSRGQCLQCHNGAAGRVLGFEPIQLDHRLTYPGGRRAPQLDTLAHIGLFDPAPRPDGAAPLEALVATDDPDASLEERARSYLHSNCAYCHLPDGLARAEFDIRFGTPLAETDTCDIAPRQGDLGVDDARLLAPGAPARSALLDRMARRDAYGMAPISSLRVDEEGVALVRAWIESLESCP